MPIGALVSVRPGGTIPCDGVVVEGSSAVDESSLTGESKPVVKLENDVVSGGTTNAGNGQLIVQTTATADDSAVAQLIRLLEEAQTNRSRTEKVVDKFARIYTPIVVLAAIAMCTIPWAIDPETGSKWVHNGLVLIIVACPCALVISTPVTCKSKFCRSYDGVSTSYLCSAGGSHLLICDIGQIRLDWRQLHRREFLSRAVRISRRWV